MTKRLRTAIVVGPSSSDRGGISSLLALWSRSADIFASAGYRVEFHGSTTRSGVLTTAIQDLISFAKFVWKLRLKPDIVHVHTSWRVSFLRKCPYVIASRLRGSKVVLHAHPTAFVSFVANLWPPLRQLAIAVLRGADAVVVVNDEMKTSLGAILPAGPVHRIPNPVDSALFSRSDQTPRDAASVAFLGWFIPSKGVIELLDAIQLLAARGSDVRLEMAGCKGESWLESQVAERSLQDRLRIHGWLDRADAVALLRRCSLLALPSHSEGMPMVLLEAMATETPIVACPVGGIPEVLEDGISACFVPVGDASALSQGILRVLENRSFREALTKNAKQAALDLGSDRILRQVVELWDELLNRASPARP